VFEFSSLAGYGRERPSQRGEKVSPDSIAAWSSVFLVLVTGALVLATHFLYRVTAKSASAAIESVQEMRRAREKESMPFVSIDIAPMEQFTAAMEIAISNLGKGPAFDVTCQFEPDIAYPARPEMRLSDLEVFKELKYLGPGERRVFLFGESLKIFQSDEVPKIFHAHLSFKDVFGTSHEYQIPIDLRSRQDIYYSPRTTLKQIDSRLEKIQKSMDRLARALEATLAKSSRD